VAVGKGGSRVALKPKLSSTIHSNPTAPTPTPLRTNSKIREETRLKNLTPLLSRLAIKLTSGFIAGRVFGRNNRPIKGALVLAYLLPEKNRLYADTLNPAAQKPDYLAQTDSAGRFQLNYLVEGEYRLIAIDDKVANRRYDFAQEEFAVPFHPVRTGMTNVLMRLALEPDTTELELQVAEARHAHSVCPALQSRCCS
jgi:hypothetical protein